jgi:beta-barrel assembly-enhancing protease
MTALERYAKLEAVGRYLDGISPDAREVVVSFGARSLIIVGLDDRPIAHWPLASLRALGPPAKRPMELVPDRASDERLLLEDGEMSAAIAEVCPGLHPPPAVRRGRRLERGPGALLAAVLVAALAGAGYLALTSLPERLSDMVPPEREAALGEAVAARLPVLLAAGQPGEGQPRAGDVAGLCVAEQGTAALRALSARLAPGLASPLRVSVLDHPGVDALALPGGRVVVLRGLIDRARSPEEVAAVLAHAAGHAAHRHALEDALDRGSVGAATILLGEVRAQWALDALAGAVLDPVPTADAEAVADADAFAALAAAGLPTRPLADFMERLAAEPGAASPYLAAHPWSDARAASVAAADSVGEAPFRPALRDRDWIALGSICDRTARPSQ